MTNRDMAGAVRQRYAKGIDSLVDAALLSEHDGTPVRDGGSSVSLRKSSPISGARACGLAMSLTMCRYINERTASATVAAPREPESS